MVTFPIQPISILLQQILEQILQMDIWNTRVLQAMHLIRLLVAALNVISMDHGAHSLSVNVS